MISQASINWQHYLFSSSSIKHLLFRGISSSKNAAAFAITELVFIIVVAIFAIYFGCALNSMKPRRIQPTDHMNRFSDKSLNPSAADDDDDDVSDSSIALSS